MPEANASPLPPVAAAAAEREARAVVAALHAAGFQAFWAGGCVRDRLLGRIPSDYDVSTDASPGEIMRIFPRHSAVGAQFGVVLVHHADGRDTAVATFRTEGAYPDGRHPARVAFPRDPKADIARRDFTINGLLYE